MGRGHPTMGYKSYNHNSQRKQWSTKEAISTSSFRWNSFFSSEGSFSDKWFSSFSEAAAVDFESLKTLNPSTDSTYRRRKNETNLKHFQLRGWPQAKKRKWKYTCSCFPLPLPLIRRHWTLMDFQITITNGTQTFQYSFTFLFPLLEWQSWITFQNPSIFL